MSKFNEKAVSAFEQFCSDVTESIVRLSVLLETSPDLVEYPLSPVVVRCVMDAYAMFTSPVEERDEFDPKELYSGSALTVDDFVEVARRIQPEIIPER